MLIRLEEPDENDIYLELVLKAKFTGRYYHDSCFWQMVQQRFGAKLIT